MFVFAARVSTKDVPPEFISMFDAANAEGLARIDDIVQQNPFDLYDMKEYYTLDLS